MDALKFVTDSDRNSCIVEPVVDTRHAVRVQLHIFKTQL